MSTDTQQLFTDTPDPKPCECGGTLTYHRDLSTWGSVPVFRCSMCGNTE